MLPLFCGILAVMRGLYVHVGVFSRMCRKGQRVWQHGYATHSQNYSKMCRVVTDFSQQCTITLWHLCRNETALLVGTARGPMELEQSEHK